MVGDGIPPLFQRGYAARGLVLTEADLAAGAADYAANATVETALYPGALAALKELRAEGWRLAVCTNKPEAPARSLLDHLGVLPFLAAVGGGDSFAVRKPDPGHVRLTVAAAGGDMGRSVMIGDHHNDVAAGKAAGLPTIFASWGYGPEEVGARGRCDCAGVWGGGGGGGAVGGVGGGGEWIFAVVAGPSRTAEIDRDQSVGSDRKPLSGRRLG